MKKLLVTLFVAVSFSAHAFIGNVGRSTALDYAKNPVAETVEKQFLNVKANGAISAGAVVSLDLTADDGATVVVAPVTGLAPICVMVNACASGALCKCQNYGLIDAALFDSTGANAVAGNRAFISTNNAGYISARATDLATEVPVGYFYDAASASASVQFFIKL